MLKEPAQNSKSKSYQKNSPSTTLMFLPENSPADKSNRKRLKIKRKEVADLQRDVELIQTQLSHTIEEINAAKDLK